MPGKAKVVRRGGKRKRVLPPKYQQPLALTIGRMCETFGCLPSQAMKELRRDPELVARVLEARAYEDAFHRFRNSKDDDSLPANGTDPMMDVVWKFQAEAMRRRRQG